MIMDLPLRQCPVYKYRFTCDGVFISGEIRADDYGAAQNKLEKIMRQHSEIVWYSQPSQEGRNLCTDVSLICLVDPHTRLIKKPQEKIYKEAEEENEIIEVSNRAGVLASIGLLLLIILIGVFGGELMIKLFFNR